MRLFSVLVLLVFVSFTVPSDAQGSEAAGLFNFPIANYILGFGVGAMKLSVTGRLLGLISDWFINRGPNGVSISKEVLSNSDDEEDEEDEEEDDFDTHNHQPLRADEFHSQRNSPFSNPRQIPRRFETPASSSQFMQEDKKFSNRQGLLNYGQSRHFRPRFPQAARQGKPSSYRRFPLRRPKYDPEIYSRFFTLQPVSPEMSAAHLASLTNSTSERHPSNSSVLELGKEMPDDRDEIAENNSTHIISKRDTENSTTTTINNDFSTGASMRTHDRSRCILKMICYINNASEQKVGYGRAISQFFSSAWHKVRPGFVDKYFGYEQAVAVGRTDSHQGCIIRYNSCPMNVINVLYLAANLQKSDDIPPIRFEKSDELGVSEATEVQTGSTEIPT